MASVNEKSVCGGEHATLAEAFVANRSAESGDPVCHVESENRFSLLSSPHLKKVYVLKEGAGDICPTLFYGDYEAKDGKACAQEMERISGGTFRLGPLKSKCPHHHPMTFAPSIICNWTLEVQKVTPERSVALTVKELKSSFEASIQNFLSVFFPEPPPVGGL